MALSSNIFEEKRTYAQVLVVCFIGQGSFRCLSERHEGQHVYFIWDVREGLGKGGLVNCVV